jgi:hypothetical protein
LIFLLDIFVIECNSADHEYKQSNREDDEKAASLAHRTAKTSAAQYSSDDEYDDEKNNQDFHQSAVVWFGLVWVLLN